MSPSSNSTMVPAMASSSDMPSRSSSTTWRGVYSPASSNVPIANPAAGGADLAEGGADAADGTAMSPDAAGWASAAVVWVVSDMDRRLLSGQAPAPTWGLWGAPR